MGSTGWVVAALVTAVAACSATDANGPDAGAAADSAPTGASGATRDTGTPLGTSGPSPEAGTPLGASGSSGLSSSDATTSGAKTFGDPKSGTLSIGPVDFAETYYPNGCAKYPAPLPTLYGNLLAGVETAHIAGGRMCDSCIRVQSVTGRSAIARVITYGGTGTNDIDVSPELNTALGIVDEAGRAVTWQFIECPANGPVYFHFADQSHQWYFRVWIRNERVPVDKVEVKVGTHDYVALEVAGDGAWNSQAPSGTDYTQGFTLRVTSVQNTSVERAFGPAPAIYTQGPFEAPANL